MAVRIFYGFQNYGAFSEETVDPSRNVPRAMIIALLGTRGLEPQGHCASGTAQPHVP
jgi:amino acid transporter